MKRGEALIFHAKDKDGNIIKTFNLVRTHRPYNYDLADAYNAERSQRVLDEGGVWMPTAGGGVALVRRRGWTEANTKRLEEMHEAEREQWKYRRDHPYEQDGMFDSSPETDW